MPHISPRHSGCRATGAMRHSMTCRRSFVPTTNRPALPIRTRAAITRRLPSPRYALRAPGSPCARKCRCMPRSPSCSSALMAAPTGPSSTGRGSGSFQWPRAGRGSIPTCAPSRPERCGAAAARLERRSSARTRRIRRAVLVQEGARPGANGEVEIGIIDAIVLGIARADLEEDGLRVGPVLQMMAVGLARLESGAVARPQHLFARIADQHDLALEDVYELILRRMPVPLAGPRAGRQAQQIDAELGEARHIPQPQPLALPARLVVGRRIAAAERDFDCREIYFLHVPPPTECEGCWPKFTRPRSRP